MNAILRCVNANDEQCRHPDCGCHCPAPRAVAYATLVHRLHHEEPNDLLQREAADAIQRLQVQVDAMRSLEGVR